MDTAGELAKCREAAEKIMVRLGEVIVTELLAARADALREFGTPYRVDQGPGLVYLMGEELAREVQARRSRGL